MSNRKVTVVGGAGNVGATVARCVAEKELADVVLLEGLGRSDDLNRARVDRA